MRQIALILAASLTMAGCAAPINIRSAEIHAQAGYSAEARGDWDSARRQFAQAVVNADLGHAGPDAKGAVNYEYGRSLGVMCEYAMAEQYLLRSKELAVQAGRSPYLSLYELAVLNQKQSKTPQALQYFSELVPAMEREGLASSYPLGAVDVYERYASALAISGNATEAAAQRGKAQEIRAANPGAQPFGAVTPYGQACAKSP